MSRSISALMWSIRALSEPKRECRASDRGSIAALVAAVLLIAGRLHQPLPACTLFHISGNDFTLRGGPMQKIGTCIILGILFLTAAWPQASSSSVGGTVRDPGQAVVRS